MSLEIIETDDAYADVVEIAYRIAEEADIDIAARVVSAIHDSYKKLADYPGIGATRDYGVPDLGRLRMFPVPRHSVYLIFYQTTDSQLIIRRVLHGSRDIERLMTESLDA